MSNSRRKRIHPEFEKLLADSPTGRLAKREPELQRLPLRTEEGKKIREAFLPPAGSIYVDPGFSDIELRIYASLVEEDDRTSEEPSDDD